ncbi:DNA-binding protein, partial [Salmonella enterica subsp. salamae]|nr:DNA-binding protein [Salmonella enterica subsp. salamae]
MSHQKLVDRQRNSNHSRRSRSVGNEPEWKVEKQPRWLVAA